MATEKPKRRTGASPGSPKARAAEGIVPDDFYKAMVWNLRNGVVAVTRDGRLAVMNDVAYRVLGLKPRASDIGRPFAEVFQAYKGTFYDIDPLLFSPARVTVTALDSGRTFHAGAFDEALLDRSFGDAGRS